MTVNVALAAPAAMDTVAGTLATDALLLERATDVAPLAALANDTVPCTVAPAAIVDVDSDTVMVAAGAVGVDEPEH